MDVIVKGQPSIEVRMDAKVVDSYKTVDAALSESSVNPVQNKAITAELKKKVDAVNLATINDQRIDEGGNIVIKGGGESYDDTALKEAISKKADKNGIYPDMSVGQSANLLGVSDGESGEFLFRPTDGDGSIKDGIASIERIEGNSVVWNQHIKGIIESVAGLSISISDDGIISINGTATSALANFFATDYGVGGDALKNAPLGRYVLDVKIINNPDNLGVNIFAFNGRISFPNTGNYTTSYQKIGDCCSLSVGGGFGISSYGGIGTVFNNVRFKVSLYNLTQMFGAGNEPTTIEEFNARKPKVEDEYAYNEGEVINMCADFIKTVGFNAWDEEWEMGSFTSSLGKPYDTQSLRSKNPIKVIPNASYFCSLGKSGGVSLYCYGKDYDFLGASSVVGDIANKTFTIPSNCHYINISIWASYGLTYNHDICIHLVHTGYRNGEYEPYVSNEKALPIADYFPNGMNAIGDVKDELTPTEAIQRIGVVDLGTLDYTASTSNAGVFYATIADMQWTVLTQGSIIQSWLCAKYNLIKNTGLATMEDKSICAYSSIEKRIQIKDTTYTDAASFKAAMAGVMLYYELAEPIVTKIDTPLVLTYPAWDFGTEEIIADTPTTPFRGSIIYEFNARDTIRANKKAIEGMAIEDYADGKLKVSINGVSKDFMAATPSGDPMHYMYLTAGAEYNDTGADITRTGVYGDTIVWKAGYWWLNELGDITNEEMREIYQQGYYLITNSFLNSIFYTSNLRTMICFSNGDVSAHDENSAYKDCYNLEVINPTTTNIGTHLRGCSYWAQNSSKLRKVLKNVYLRYISNTTDMFKGCAALEYITIYFLTRSISFADSPLLSIKSILHIINNEGSRYAEWNNNPIVITLHADAYARAMADEAITTALAAHPNVSLASA